MKIAFDIGGVITRYPAEMKTLMRALQAGGIDVHIMSDIPMDTLRTLIELNDLAFIPVSNVHSADWAADQDMCKSKMCESLGIDMLIDDRPDYCAVGNFIGLVVSPRPATTSYYAEGWKNLSEKCNQ